VDQSSSFTPESVAMAAAAWVMRSPRRFAAAERSSRVARLLWRQRIRSLPPPLSAWTSSRDLPAPPAETFREWWHRTRGTS
jgi:L-lactate dehydrogenase complex protein LldF